MCLSVLFQVLKKKKQNTKNLQGNRKSRLSPDGTRDQSPFSVMSFCLFTQNCSLQHLGVVSSLTYRDRIPVPHLVISSVGNGDGLLARVHCGPREVMLSGSYVLGTVPLSYYPCQTVTGGLGSRRRACYIQGSCSRSPDLPKLSHRVCCVLGSLLSLSWHWHWVLHTMSTVSPDPSPCAPPTLL